MPTMPNVANDSTGLLHSLLYPLSPNSDKNEISLLIITTD